MYLSIQPSSALSLSYPIVFMIRRTLFVGVTFSLFNMPSVQTQLWMSLTIMHIAYLNYIPLFDGAINRRIDVTNECLMMLVTYHLIACANYRVWVHSISKGTSFSMVMSILLILIFNTAMMVLGIIKNIK